MAPRPNAACAVARSHEVCPIAAIAPAATMESIASSPPGNSGAIVTILTAGSASSRRTSSAAGGCSRASPWAPRCAGDSQGPSRWMPPSAPSRTSGASAATCSSSRPTASEARDAMMVVVPRAACQSIAGSTRRSVASAKWMPAAPWAWMSTNPGMTVPRSAVGAGATGADPTGAASGGEPRPTSRMREPSTRIQPGARTSSPVTTVPAV